MDQIRTTIPAPPDLPDDPVDVMPVFTKRRKAELLPPLRPAALSNRLEAAVERGPNLVRSAWHSGFRWGVVASVGGFCIIVTLAVGMWQ